MVVGVHDSEGEKLYEGVIISSATYQEDVTPKRAEDAVQIGLPLGSITTFYTVRPVDEDGEDAGQEAQRIDAKYVREL
jgi:hypothetical protein